MGGTDCALPMSGRDGENMAVESSGLHRQRNMGGAYPPGAGAAAVPREDRHRGQADRSRHESNGFTIADPNDAGMLDVVGFDMAPRA